MHCPNCNSEFKDGVLECPYCDIPLIQSPSKLNTEPHSHPSKYLSDLEEWNRNQYNPGYWTGGNIPPHIKVLSKGGSKTIGIVALICGIFIFGIIINSLLNIDFHNYEELLPTILGSIVGAFFGTLLVWAGIQRIKESKTNNK